MDISRIVEPGKVVDGGSETLLPIPGLPHCKYLQYAGQLGFEGRPRLSWLG